MSNVVIASIDLPRWAGPTSDVELRVSLDQPIITPTLESFSPSPAFVAKAACTIASSVIAGVTQYTLTIPSITLPATGDALVGRTARYSAGFYTANGKLIMPWEGFQQFSLSAVPTPTDWGTIRVANEGGVLPLYDTRTFTRAEILSLLQVYVRYLSGWGTATGTEDKTAIAAYVAPVISTPPTQAEVQALATYVQELSQRVVALINALKE